MIQGLSSPLSYFAQRFGHSDIKPTIAGLHLAQSRQLVLLYDAGYEVGHNYSWSEICPGVTINLLYRGQWAPSSGVLLDLEFLSESRSRKRH